MSSLADSIINTDSYSKYFDVSWIVRCGSPATCHSSRFPQVSCTSHILDRCSVYSHNFSHKHLCGFGVYTLKLFISCREIAMRHNRLFLTSCFWPNTKYNAFRKWSLPHLQILKHEFGYACFKKRLCVWHLQDQTLEYDYVSGAASAGRHIFCVLWSTLLFFCISFESPEED